MCVRLVLLCCCVAQELMAEVETEKARAAAAAAVRTPVCATLLFDNDGEAAEGLRALCVTGAEASRVDRQRQHVRRLPLCGQCGLM